MRDWIASNAVNLGGSVHVIDAEGAAQIAISDLPGSRFLAGNGGGEGEYAPGAHGENTADQALLAHAQTNQPIIVTMLLQELRHDHVVVKAGSCGNNLVILSGNFHHAGESLFELLRRFEVVVREDERGSTTELL